MKLNRNLAVAAPATNFAVPVPAPCAHSTAMVCPSVSLDFIVSRLAVVDELHSIPAEIQEHTGLQAG